MSRLRWDPGSGPAPPRPTRLEVLLLLGILAAFLAQVRLFWSQLNDDAFITFRYSLHLAGGVGPYFNPGEHVEGYTNFLHMGTLAGVARFLGPEALPVAAKLLGVLSGLGSVGVAALLAWVLLRDTAPRIAAGGALVAGALVAASPSFAVNTTSGLETAPYACFLGLGCLLDLARAPRGRWLPSAIAFALAALSRPEGVLIFGAYWLARFLQSRDPARFRSLALVTAVVLLQVAFRWFAYEGEWLPNTYFAKRGGHWGPVWPYVRDGFLVPLGGAAGIALGGAGGWLSPRNIRRPLLALAVPAVVGGLSPFLTGTDWMIGHRLLVPYLPLAAPVVASGWLLLALRVVPAAAKAPALLLLAPILLGAAQDPARGDLARYVGIRSRGYLEGHARVADWCRDSLDSREAIALMDIGIVGFRCLDHPILDLTGLTDRHIAKSPGTFLKKLYDPAYVLDRRPAAIVLVLGLDRVPGQTPLPGSRFYFVNPIERRLAEAPEFERFYRRPPPRDLPPDWRVALGRLAGAEAVFEHDHPRVHYLLAVFRRRE